MVCLARLVGDVSSFGPEPLITVQARSDQPVGGLSLPSGHNQPQHIVRVWLVYSIFPFITVVDELKWPFDLALTLQSRLKQQQGRQQLNNKFEGG
jgi:hypothetical protein